MSESETKRNGEIRAMQEDIREIKAELKELIDLLKNPNGMIARLAVLDHKVASLEKWRTASISLIILIIVETFFLWLPKIL